jgi:hypothetical protein
LFTPGDFAALMLMLSALAMGLREKMSSSSVLKEVTDLS